MKQNLAYMLALVSLCRAEDGYPSCGDCWCIPSNDGLGPCPIWQPQMNFSEEVISTYRRQIPASWYSLSCNPYEESTCATTPPQEMLDVEDAVCAFMYPVDSSGSKSCDTYEMKTFSSRRDAELAGGVVTHAGSCGLCSTTQDLALYLSEHVG
jgi:hypothetical protein